LPSQTWLQQTPIFPPSAYKIKILDTWNQIPRLAGYCCSLYSFNSHNAEVIVLLQYRLSQDEPGRKRSVSVRQNKGIDPHFLDLGTSWRWVVRFTPRPLHPRGKSLRHPLDRRLGGPQNQSGRRGEEKILDPTETRTPTPRSSTP
jgi:hypothetical protein